jgi:hypothetical protein
VFQEAGEWMWCSSTEVPQVCARPFLCLAVGCIDNLSPRAVRIRKGRPGNGPAAGAREGRLEAICRDSWPSVFRGFLPCHLRSLPSSTNGPSLSGGAGGAEWCTTSWFWSAPNASPSTRS